MPEFTDDQKLVIDNRGGNLLVSAAAGSGKTTVLVERLLAYLTDEKNPANVDDFLIITYTKAAAAELRVKIAEKLNQRITEAPNNRHLQEQLQRLYMAHISTVHSFCSDVLREYAYNLDIPADFRVAEEFETEPMMLRAAEQVLEEAYGEMTLESDFYRLVKTQGLGRTDTSLIGMIQGVYTAANCHKNPEEYLQMCAAPVDPDGSVEDTPWGSYLLTLYRGRFRMFAESLANAQKLVDGQPGYEKITEQLAYLKGKAERAAEAAWDDIYPEISSYERYQMRKNNRMADESLIALVNSVYKACKGAMAKYAAVFVQPEKKIMADAAQMQSQIRGICDLVRKFAKCYGDGKRRRHIMDFTDLEQNTLQLLWGKNRDAVTAAAREIGSRYREVMVDEYQDSNGVQDAIFEAITADRNNCFTVGDVKQSIYRFRLADPTIFLKKYNAYPPAVKDQKDSNPRKILLSSNFRSSGGVIEAVNSVFSFAMSPQVGDLRYTEKEALYEGVKHDALPEPEVSLHVLSTDGNAIGEEAAFTAGRIRELCDGTHMIRDKEDQRPITYGDIVILLRSPGSTGYTFVQALQKEHIPVYYGVSEDLLKTEEVGALYSILQAVANPEVDIPFVAAMASKVFGFTADELATLRAGKKKMPFADAVRQSDMPKARAFLTALAQFRTDSAMYGVTELIDRILNTTKLDSIYAAMPNGQMRRNNIQAFCQLAAAFENGGRGDLYSFMDYLSARQEKGVTVENEGDTKNAVRIMSIHKSKGLEFPVVFLCNLSKRFNDEDVKGNLLCDRNLGIGLKCVDSEKRIRYPSLAFSAISARKKQDGHSEELRVLYVAMTRARDRLEMVYAEKSPLSKLDGWNALLPLCQREMLTDVSAAGMGDWVLMTALQRTEAGALFQAAQISSSCARVRNSPWNITYTETSSVEKRPEELAGEKSPMMPEAVEKLEHYFRKAYAYGEAVTVPSKLTATQLKGREKDAESAEFAAAAYVPGQWRKPAFAGGSDRKPTTFGTMLHKVMQYLPYEKCNDEASVAAQLALLTQKGLITPEEARGIDLHQLTAFFYSEPGKMLKQAEKVLREFKFSVLVEAGDSEALKNERILLQGVADLAMLEPDGITLVDFKTDRGEDLPLLTERYRPQVEAYATALSKIFGLPVKRKYLYFFRFGQAVVL